MSLPWRELLLAGLGLAGAQPTVAQQIRELGFHAGGTFSDPAVVVGGGYGALRTSGRTRVSLSLAAGVADHKLVGRAELLGHFLLSPEARRKPGFYLAGGIAGVEGKVSRGYLVLTAGVERAPRRSSGWALELGLGGGVRVALGYRWRWFPAAGQ
jgi:hypothetical protein